MIRFEFLRIGSIEDGLRGSISEWKISKAVVVLKT